AGSWEQMKHSSDTTTRSISFDFVHAFGFGPRGEVWYGSVGNGWGLSTDGGKTWTNWALNELGPEWQYVAPNGIVTRGDTVYVGTADGIKLSWDRGVTWAEITDSSGALSAPHSWGRLRSQYVLALARGSDGALWAGHLRGLARPTGGGRCGRRHVRGGRCRAQRLRHDPQRQRAAAARAGDLRSRATYRFGDLPHRSAADARGRQLPGAPRHGLPRHATHLVRTAHCS